MKQEMKGIPKGAIEIKVFDEHVWRFEYPRINNEAYDLFDEAIDLWHESNYSDAEKIYRKLIKDFPEFIDVYHHLALLLNKTERDQEAFNVWQKAVDIGKQCLPESFYFGRDQLPWIILENRPFLRAYHSLGLAYHQSGEVEKALSIFMNILDMNPNDNQGVRGLVIDCYFRLRRPGDVLKICDRFPRDGMETVLFGQALAWFQLGQLAKAERVFRDGITSLPLVAKELAKTRHRRPEDTQPGYITYGGADQAYYYWVGQGSFWKITPGAIDFVRECIEKYGDS
jgi:tetratricopeptide (TPR) repeat protein